MQGFANEKQKQLKKNKNVLYQKLLMWHVYWSWVKACQWQETLPLHYNVLGQPVFKSENSLSFFLFLSLDSYICIVLRQAGWSGLRTAWGCVLHRVYLIAWPPTVTARFKSNTKCFLSCSPLHNPKANLPGAPCRRSKRPVYLRRVETTANF